MHNEIIGLEQLLISGGGLVPIMSKNKFRNLIPDISLKTSYENPLKKLGLYGVEELEEQKNAILDKYKAYSGIVKQKVPTGTSQTALSANYIPGIRVANSASYNNDAVKGQCVWYVRGRAKEKLGVDTGAIGNANEMYYNAKESAKVSASAQNIKPNMIVSYSKGTGTTGQTYGHVIFIEDVVGDTVYYTEGGSGYYKNGTDGVVKTATRQGIIDGVNTSGARMGSGVLGFIDLSKY